MSITEIRLPTPGKEKLEILNRHAERELLEPINWGNFVYIEIPKYKLAKFKNFVTKNRIAKKEQIEEVQSILPTPFNNSRKRGGDCPALGL